MAFYGSFTERVKQAFEYGSILSFNTLPKNPNYIAYNRKELSDHIIAMATPIFNFDGKVDAVIVVSPPEIRLTSQKEKLIERALREGSETLSGKLGFKGQTEKVGKGSTTK